MPLSGDAAAVKVYTPATTIDDGNGVWTTKRNRSSPGDSNPVAKVHNNGKSSVSTTANTVGTPLLNLSSKAVTPSLLSNKTSPSTNKKLSPLFGNLLDKTRPNRFSSLEPVTEDHGDERAF